MFSKDILTAPVRVNEVVGDKLKLGAKTMDFVGDREFENVWKITFKEH